MQKLLKDKLKSWLGVSESKKESKTKKKEKKAKPVKEKKQKTSKSKFSKKERIKESIELQKQTKDYEKEGPSEGLYVEKLDKEVAENEIESVLTDSPNIIEEIKNQEGTYIILFFGINGTGKTTTISKIAHLLKKNNISVALAAADTFRA